MGGAAESAQGSYAHCQAAAVDARDVVTDSTAVDAYAVVAAVVNERGIVRTWVGDQDGFSGDDFDAIGRTNS